MKLGIRSCASSVVGHALRAAWIPGAFGVAIVACAAGRGTEGVGGSSGGADTGTTSTAGGSGTVSSSTSGGGTGGQTSGTTSGGSGGEGGTSSSTSETMTTSGMGGTTSGNGGGGAGGGSATSGKVVLLAGGASSLIEGAFEENAGWSLATIPVSVASAPALSLTSMSEGIGLFLAMGDTKLSFVKWDGAGFSSPLSIGMQPSAKGSPTLVSGQDAYSAAYWGTENAHYLVRYTGALGGWSLPEPVKPPGGFHSTGNSAPSVALADDDVIVAHAGTDGKVYEQRRLAGTWEPATGHDVGGAKTDLAITIATLVGGAQDLLIVYVLAANSQIGWIARTGGASPAWTPAATITDALTQDRVVVAPLPNGGAVIAFRGLNSGVYTSIYKPGANPLWSAPAPLASPNYTTPSHPAIAPGIGVAQAELAFVDSATGAALHARLVNDAWTSPEVIGGADLEFVGVASSAGE